MATTVHSYRGSCHCGEISVTLSLPRLASDMQVRACQCRFCRPRGTRTIADRAGSVPISAASPDNIRRYRFGLVRRLPGARLHDVHLSLAAPGRIQQGAAYPCPPKS